MTENYIEIIKRSPYYYQVDGAMMATKFPDGVCGDVWEAWKQNLPDCCEKEKVFLDMVALDEENSYSFVETMRKIGPVLDKDFMEFVEKKKDTLEQMHQDAVHSLLLPSSQCFARIRESLKQCNGTTERVSYFFLRTAVQHYHDDWTATRMCFQNLLSGKILLGVGPYTKHTCFTAETPVWTTHGVKRIDQVVVGDLVPTHNGRFCRVAKTFRNKTERRTLYRVHTVLGPVATATDNHPFLVYSTEYHQILWKHAGDLNANTDFLMRSSLVQSPSYHLSSPLRRYPLLNTFLHRHPRVIGVALSRVMGNEGTVHVDVQKCMESLPGEELTIYEDIILLLTDTMVRMAIWAWTLETNQHVLVQGWWDAFQSRTVFVDYEEAQMVRMVMNLYGHDVVLKKPPWSARWCLVGRAPRVRCCPRREDVLYVGEKVFVRFSHKRKMKEQPFVYTLAVDRDHSFTVNGYIVKNCSGATPDTMVMSGDRLVPIAQLRPGDYILDKNYEKRKIRSVLHHHYEGPVVSLYGSSYTAITGVYLQNKTSAQPISAVRDYKEMASPSLACYYDESIDKQQYPPHIINFLLRYLCEWDVREENGWYHWHVSVPDMLSLHPTLSASFLCFQYRLQEGHVRVQKEPLISFLQKLLDGLVHVSPDKRRYFFSYLDRAGTDRLTHEQSHFCHTLRSFLVQEVALQKQNYVGDIYDLEVEGDGFCAPGVMVQKDFKCGIGGDWQQASYLYLPDLFFQQINRDCEWENQRQTSDIWQEIVRSQLQTGKPSLLCVDRNKNECVSGDTRILTAHGVVPISSKKDEIVPVWNGTRFTDVMITRTGHEKKFLKVHLSNGLCLTCTPYHKLFVISDGKIEKVNASDVVGGDEIAPFQLPSLSTMDILPSSIVMTLEWIAKRCVCIEKDVVLFDRDVESLKDILLDLQYCGLNSEITYNPHRNEYELRMDRTRWNLLNYRHLNKNVSYIEGDVVQHVRVIKTEETHTYQESYCFHEPFSGTSIFEGVATGQCENLSDVVCAQGCIDISRFLKTNPSKKQLKNHQVIVYTTKDCPFVRLLRLEYKNLEVREIETWEEEWKIKRHAHALSTVPAIFLDNLYVGNFMDFWKHYLCPVFDTENLRQAVYSLCQGLDCAIDQEKNVANAFCFLSNRPIVLVVWGFRDVLIHMKLSMEEAETQQLNKIIFETIHYAALKASSDLAAKRGPCISSDKIYSIFETMVRPHDNLRHNIVKHGLRNMIYIRTEEEENRTTHLFGSFLQHIGTADIPNSLKTIYQDEYEVCQKQRLQRMLDRKKYNVVDETFHLYLDKNIPEQEVSELQQEIWREGFHIIRIHHRTKK